MKETKYLNYMKSTSLSIRYYMLSLKIYILSYKCLNKNTFACKNKNKIHDPVYALLLQLKIYISLDLNLDYF